MIEIWEPTYRMTPMDERRFVPETVNMIIKAVLDKKLATHTYSETESQQVALDLCAEIKEKVKALNIPRYKIILQSVIGEIKGQGAYITSRCLWDTKSDNYASYSFQNASMFCTVMVFGLYLE